MIRLTLLFTTISFLACNGSSSKQGLSESIKKDSIASQNEYLWTKLLDSAAWKKSYNFQMLEINDTLWTLHPDGNWYSTDGKNWVKSPLKNTINNLAFLDYVKFNNAIFGLGYLEGNIEQHTYKSEIHKTSDFKKWTTIIKNSNLPQRFFYHPFAFENKIWFIGGEDKNTQYSDIWNSEDCMTWTMQKSNLPFGKRSNSIVASLKGKLYLLNNDVWSSDDGLNWTLVTNEILKGETVFGYSAVVYDDKIWLLGCNRNGKFKSQVLVSSDGKNWVDQATPWSPRGGIAATVYKDKIIMTGGKYGGIAKDGTTTEFIYSNDVWTLEKKK